MDEARFRELVVEAVGEARAPLTLAHSVRSRLVAPPRRAVGPALAAAALAAAVVGGLVLHQVTRHDSVPVAPITSTPSPSPPAAAVDPAACSLPVVVSESYGMTVRGYVDTSSGVFIEQGTVAIAGNPKNRTVEPVAYSPQLGRWLPADPAAMSPDGLAYAYARQLDSGASELHRVDGATGRDTVVWRLSDAWMYVERWTPGGILVRAEATSPTSVPGDWIVDPATGRARQASGGGAGPDGTPGFTPLPGDPTGVALSVVGLTGAGSPVIRFGSRDAGSVEWIFYEVAPGVRAYVYRGTQGDSTGFDPEGLVEDTTGFWFGSPLRPVIWRWQAGGQLVKVAVTGLPGSMRGGPVSMMPAGPCY